MIISLNNLGLCVRLCLREVGWLPVFVSLFDGWLEVSQPLQSCPPPVSAVTNHNSTGRDFLHPKHSILHILLSHLSQLSQLKHQPILPLELAPASARELEYILLVILLVMNDRISLLENIK